MWPKSLLWAEHPKSGICTISVLAVQIPSIAVGLCKRPTWPVAALGGQLVPDLASVRTGESAQVGSRAFPFVPGHFPLSQQAFFLVGRFGFVVVSWSLRVLGRYRVQGFSSCGWVFVPIPMVVCVWFLGCVEGCFALSL